MNRKQQIVKAVANQLKKTAGMMDILHQRLPTPEEFAVDVVDFLYGVAQKETDEETKEEKKEVRPTVQDTPEGVRGAVEGGDNP